MRDKDHDPNMLFDEGKPVRRSRRVGQVRLPLINRRAGGLLVVAAIALAWSADCVPAREVARARLSRGARDSVTRSFAFSPDGGRIGTTDHEGRLALWDESKGWAVEGFRPFPLRADTLGFSPDGRILACGGRGAGLTIWDLPSNEWRVVPVPIDRVKCLAFSPDGRSLAVTTERDGRILLWDMVAGRVKRTFSYRFPVQSIAFSRDGRQLFVGGRELESGIAIWDLETGDHRRRLGETRARRHRNVLLARRHLTGHGRRVRALRPHLGAAIGRGGSPT